MISLSERDFIQQLDEYVHQLTQADQFSGALLVAREGRVLYQKAAGEAHKDFQVPNHLGTKFNLGSLNKMFTAMAILQLAEAGKLGLEDPVEKFLTNVIDPASAKIIQVQHLLTHTSGLGNYFNQKFFSSSRTLFRTVKDMLALVEGEKHAFPPGTRFQYSNTGFLLLGAIIEKVSGRDYYDFVREHIFIPAQMKNTDSYSLDKVNSHLAVGYYRQGTGKEGPFKNNIFEHVLRGGPAGGGYSTVEDLLRFHLSLASHHLLGPSWTQMMMTGKPELNSPNYGYGLEVESAPGLLPVVGHRGDFPGITTQLDMFPQEKWTSIVLSNYSGVGRPLVTKIRQLLLQAQRT